MSAEKTEAIVLRVVDFSETSAIVTLMTRDFGKMTAIAKGARRRKSPFEAALDVLAVCRIVFLRKPQGTMELLTEAKLERRFRNSARRLDSLYGAMYVAELLRLLTDEGDPHPGAYDLAREALEQLDTAGEAERILIPFEINLLRELGHVPSLNQCAGCGVPRTASGAVPFGLDAGGVLCQKCRPGQRNVIRISAAAWQTLERLINGNRLLPDEEWPRGEVRKLMNSFMTHLIGYPPRLHRFLESSSPKTP